MISVSLVAEQLINRSKYFTIEYNNYLIGGNIFGEYMGRKFCIILFPDYYIINAKCDDEHMIKHVAFMLNDILHSKISFKYYTNDFVIFEWHKYDSLSKMNELMDKQNKKEIYSLNCIIK